MTVIVDIALALICFSHSPGADQTCEHILIGADTPRGTYQLQQRLTDSPFYGGDVLQFKEDEKEVYAVHRVWLGRPYEHREKRIKSDNVKDRKITMGCINVTPEVYKMLVDCCSNDELVIK